MKNAELRSPLDILCLVGGFITYHHHHLSLSLSFCLFFISHYCRFFSAVHRDVLPRFKLIPNKGSAFASSSLDNDHGPHYAFQFSTKSDGAWISEQRSQAHAIWFRFEQPQRVVKMGFASSERGASQPIHIKIIACHRCDQRTCHDFQVVLDVPIAGFNEEEFFVFKTWDIPKLARSSYLCWGVRVESVRWGPEGVMISNILMWKARTWK